MAGFGDSALDAAAATPEALGAVWPALEAQAVAAPEGAWASRARLLLLWATLRDRPWRVIFDGDDVEGSAGLKVERLRGWLGAGGHVEAPPEARHLLEAAVGRLRGLIPAEGAGMGAWSGAWWTLEQALELEGLEGALFGLLGALSGGDAEVLRLGEVLGVVRPADRLDEAAGIARPLAAALLGVGAGALTDWERRGLVEWIEVVGVGARGVRLSAGMRGLAAGLAGGTLPAAIVPGVTLTRSAASEALGALLGAAWEGLPVGSPGLRAAVVAAEPRSARAVASWLMGERPWMLEVAAGLGDAGAARWLMEASWGLGAGVYWDRWSPGASAAPAALAPWMREAAAPLVVWARREELGALESAWPGLLVLEAAALGEVMTGLAAARPWVSTLGSVTDPLVQAVQASQVVCEPSRADERLEAVRAAASARAVEVAVRPLRDTGCPLVLAPRTAAQLHEALHVLRANRDAGVRQVFRGGPRRFFIMLEGERSVLQRQAVLEMATAWGRPIYEIELSRVISRYIGEAEERLRALFDLARQTGAGLFLDEAHDFLGSRMEVKSSADRYSAMQVNYVLQELDVFDGLLVLATSRPAALDAAVRRRMLYQVNFLPLEVGERAQLWRKLVPPEAPVDPSIDWDEIAELYPLDPDRIQKALFFGAIAAARDGEVLRQEHVEAAAWELAKADV